MKFGSWSHDGLMVDLRKILFDRRNIIIQGVSHNIEIMSFIVHCESNLIHSPFFRRPPLAFFLKHQQ